MSQAAAYSEDLFFESLVESRVHQPRFVRRPWLAAALDERLALSDKRFVLLTAEPGAGKTSFIAQLADDHPEWLRYFIRRDQRKLLADCSAKSLLLRIGYQLAARHPELFSAEQLCLSVRQRVGQVGKGADVVAARIESLLASPFRRNVLQIEQQVRANQGQVIGLDIGELVTDVRLLAVEDLLELALTQPALALKRDHPADLIVILIDALDEVRYQATADNLLTWLTNCPELPDNIRFVLSSRPPDEAVKLLYAKQAAVLCQLAITEGDARVDADVQQFVTGLISEPAVAQALQAVPGGAAAFATKAAEKARGNLGYLDALARAIDQALLGAQPVDALLGLTELPTDLEGLYAFFLHQIKASVDTERIELKDTSTGETYDKPVWPSIYGRVLGVLAVALAPLDIELIERLGEIRAGRDWVLRALDHLAQFLDVTGHRYRLYHATLAEFLTDKKLENDVDHRDLYQDARQRHQQIADHYWRLRSLESGSAGSLEQIDDYGLDYLAAHLVLADWPDRVHALLDNRWVRIKEDRHGSLAELLADVGLAWQVAENSQRLDLQVRYALFESSAHSLAGNVPVSLVNALLEHQVWTPTQALRQIKQIRDDEQRAAALTILAKFLTPNLVDQAVAAARELAYEGHRIRPLARLITHACPAVRADLVADVIAAVGRLKFDSDKAAKLSAIAGQLTDEGVKAALAIALSIAFDDDRARALAGLMPYLPEETFAKVKEALQSPATDQAVPPTVEALAALARRLSDSEQKDVWLRAVDLACRAADGRAADALAAMVPDLPDDLLPQVDTAARAMRSPSGQAALVAALLPRCAAADRPALLELGMQAVDRMGGGTNPQRVRARVAFLPSLCPDDATKVFKRALCEARDGRYCNIKATALALLIPFAPSTLVNELRTEALNAISDRTDVLIALTSCLQQDNHMELVNRAAGLKSDSDRAESLGGMAQYLSPPLLQRALAAVPEIADHGHRLRLLGNLAPQLHAEQLPLALMIARALHDGDEGATASVALAEQLVASVGLSESKSLIEDVVRVTDPLERFRLLNRLRHCLLEPARAMGWDRLLETLRALEPKAAELEAPLVDIAPDLSASEVLEVLVIVDGLDIPYRRVRALLALAPALPAERIPEAVTALWNISSIRDQAKAFVALFPHLPKLDQQPLLRHILKQTQERGVSDRSSVVATLAPCLSADLITETWNEAEKFPASTGDRACTLMDLLPYLRPECQPSATARVVAAMNETGNLQRSELLAKLVVIGHLSPDLLDQALGLARGIGDDGLRCRALTALLPHLDPGLRPAVAQAALVACGTDRAPTDRIESVAGLAPFLATDAGWRQTFWEEYKVSYARDRARALLKILPFLPQDERPRYLVDSITQGARWFWNLEPRRGARERANAWAQLLDQWHKLDSASSLMVWTQGLHALASQNRADFLLDLAFFAPMLSYLGGATSVRAALQQVAEVRRIWP